MSCFYFINLLHCYVFKNTRILIKYVNLASIAAFVAINELKPDILLSAGTAGGFRRKGAQIGDPFISTFHKHHDRRIAIPGFQEYGIGSRAAFPCKNLIEVLFFQLFLELLMFLQI
jgi:nucleoside phosphorylase